MTMVKDAPAPGASQQAQSAFRSLLVHVEPGNLATPRLKVAVDLAKRLDADLIGLGAEMIRPAAISDPYGMYEAEWLVEMRRLVAEDLKLAESRFQTEAAGLRSHWVTSRDLPVRALADVSRGADLIVAGGAPPSRGDLYKVADTAQLVVLSGRPVLIAPAAGGVLSGSAVVVAWKDTREARRALADSLPFLKAAQSVVVMEVCDKDSSEWAEVRTSAVVKHLRRHGVEATPKVEVGAPDEAAGEIRATAAEVGADLIVAGGYGHSRLGEWIFGGVTRDLLHEPEHFVLLSH
jgi:nucleotide-binding universal stress UspA family protein